MRHRPSSERRAGGSTARNGRSAHLTAGIALAICCFAPMAQAADPPPATGNTEGGCVDEELKQELVAGRHYRGVQERLFTKAFRHEISAMGGLYAGDLYSSSWLVGGAYTFHFSEDLGLEASFQLTRFRTAVTDSYERRYPQVQVEERTDRPGRLYFGHLIWSFAYGKLRWMGGGITRFDFNAALGAGVTDDSTAQGLTGSFGLGTKWYLTKWLDVRIDIRDHILKETLIGEDHIVNDILVTGGFSLWIPFGG